jgi:hypothetical protein
MSKRCDAYLRTLMIHGSRSVIYRAGQKNDPESWLVKLIKRRNINVAAVALNRRPFMRQQFSNFTCPLCRQACKNILQVSVRIVPVEARRLDQTHDSRRTLTAA